MSGASSFRLGRLRIAGLVYARCVVRSAGHCVKVWCDVSQRDPNVVVFEELTAFSSVLVENGRGRESCLGSSGKIDVVRRGRSLYVLDAT